MTDLSDKAGAVPLPYIQDRHNRMLSTHLHADTPLTVASSTFLALPCWFSWFGTTLERESWHYCFMVLGVLTASGRVSGTIKKELTASCLSWIEQPGRIVWKQGHLQCDVSCGYGAVW